MISCPGCCAGREEMLASGGREEREETQHTRRNPQGKATSKKHPSRRWPFSGINQIGLLEDFGQ